MTKVLRSALVTLLLLGSGACTPNHPAPASSGSSSEDDVSYRARNEGYSILYKLMSDESDVGMLFWLKHADDSVTILVKAVGERCQAAKKQMDQFAASDKHIQLNAADLPEVEQKCRDLEADEKRHELLSSSGKEFELYLIFSQAEAMSYADNLCVAMEKVEDNPIRKKFLVELGKQAGDFHERFMKLLMAK
jgi:hypothetical protein